MTSSNPFRKASAQTLAMVVLAASLGAALPAAAENAWVKGEVRLNLRTGAGTQFRIVTGLKTGDKVAVLARNDSWTQVKVLESNKVGWIPAGFLDAEPPPGLRLAQLEEEVNELRAQLTTTTEEASTLRTQNSEIAGRDGDQRSEIERLTHDNMRLRAGARWPYMIAGASILAAGMIVGAILHAMGGRRQRPRVRL